MFLTPGVEITTGPLGQGFANGVGMAMGAAHLAAKFNQKDFPLIDHYVYAIVSDGDLMEGVASEAASLAGHLKLGKLIYLYDDNQSDDRRLYRSRFSAKMCRSDLSRYGWHTSTVEDGNDLEAIEAAIRDAQSVGDRPSLISVKTMIGYGMPTAGTRKAHSDPPGEEAVRETKRHLGWPEDKAVLCAGRSAGAFSQGCRSRRRVRKLNGTSWLPGYQEKHSELGKLRGNTTVSGELPTGLGTASARPSKMPNR